MSIALLALLTAIFLWGASFVAIKFCLEDLGPLTLIAWRFVIASVFFYYLMLKQKLPRWRLIREDPLLMGALTLTGIVLHFSLECIGMQYTSASKGALISSVVVPTSVIFLGALWLKEKLTWGVWVGVILSISGVLVVMDIAQMAEGLGMDGLWGDFLIIVSAIMWGVFTIMSKRVSELANPLELAGVICFLATPVLVFWALMAEGVPNFSSISLQAWVNLIILGAGCSFWANYLYFIALRQMNTTSVGAYLYLCPLVTYLLDYLLRGEVPTSSLILGTALVMVGITITEIKRG